MRTFDDSTLWRISAYERMRRQRGDSGFARLDQNTVLPTTLMGELAQLRQIDRATDPLEVIAACLRQRESALLLIRHQDLVWPLTVFPRQHLYHLPRSIIPSLGEGTRDLQVIAVEPPGLRPPGDVMHERIADGPGYRPIAPLLWALALHEPSAQLLQDIGGRAAYRIVADHVPDTTAVTGALATALQRLRTEIASLHDIARWPGMDHERAVRLLNATYLQGGLMVLRTHHAARESGSRGQRLRAWWRR